MFDFIVIGAAQAGLSMAYYLDKLDQNYLVVDKEDEIGASWLNRWDSLKLFTPSEFNNLPGMDFPAKKGHYPNKNQVASYFKEYVERFNIQVKLNVFIESVKKENNVFTLKHDNGVFQAKNVVVATGPFHIPYTPSFSKKISKDIFQIHSNYYKNPHQLKEGPTMVVGAGDSGFQILNEVSQTDRITYFSGATDVRVLPQEILGKTLWWWFTKTGFLSFSKKTWLGKKLSQTKQPIIGTDVRAILNRKNVIPVGNTTNAEDNTVFTESKEINNLKNVIWATGYRPNFSWIDGLELTKDSYPKHNRGISNIKGLYFIGLPWLHTRGSATLGGTKKDSKYLAEYIKETINKSA